MAKVKEKALEFKVKLVSPQEVYNEVRKLYGGNTLFKDSVAYIYTKYKVIGQVQDPKYRTTYFIVEA